jgi:intracellular sulfur oxidation DsrE/DsrF family protein
MHDKKDSPDISDELLNSFVDHQLTSEERQEILHRLKHDRALSERVCALQHLKEMTRLAYDDIPASRQPEMMTDQTGRWPRMAAAALIFGLGLLLGMIGLPQWSSGDERSSLASDSRDTRTTKVLVHLSSADPQAALNTLGNLEQMLADYRQRGEPVRVEVIANGGGVKLLGPGTPAIAQRIAALTEQYDNLSFAACRNTIEQLQLTEGRHIRLLPQIKLIDSGVVEVIRRQKEGWAYIRG